ncbi:SDR family NAD(P)-dependent oxidoreductase [Microbacterium sp. SS28]|uniref:SDR family NAD(P)-dependent oxidoreductase n=1 Tax=Microbacterium sp. SS28 TaxID=2919948 RepID=UPI001FAA31F7|nr:SDR family oxidoreductase [Microbacterium sp. SS28]
MSDLGHRFTDCAIIVTGAGSGIGRATVERLVAEGARVVAVDLLPDRLSTLTDEVAGEIVPLAVDITEPAAASAILEAAGPQVDGLANVAGIMDGFEPTAEIDDATWDRVLAVNLTAMMRLTRAVLPGMVERGRGSIVNVGSEAGQRGSAAGTPYTTSKHAVNGFTRSTAFFYTPKGVRCNAVAPGPVATNIEAPFRSEWAQQRLGPLFQTNIPAVARPEELASAIAWLLSDDASNVSGSVLSVDGGWAAI